MHKLIHEFDNFSVSRSIGGDYFIENDKGEEILLFSPNGSAEHEEIECWVCDPARQEDDFEQAHDGPVSF